MNRTKLLAVAAILGAAMAGEVLAVPIPLPPGGLVPLTPGAVGGPVLATLTDSFANSLYSGDVQSWVVNDPAWVAGLTFVYQVRLNPDVGGGLQEIHRLSTYGWTSFLTAVEQDVVAGFAGVNADRDAVGNTVGFNIPNGFAEGLNSALFIVRSDAPTYQDGIGGVIDGQTSNVDILAPSRRVRVPDGGASAMLLGLGFLCLAQFRRFLS